MGDGVKANAVKEYMQMIGGIFVAGVVLTFLLTVWVKLYKVFYQINLIPGIQVHEKK